MTSLESFLKSSKLEITQPTRQARPRQEQLRSALFQTSKKVTKKVENGAISDIPDLT